MTQEPTRNPLAKSDLLTSILPETAEDSSLSIYSLLAHIGTTFQCERVYIFEKKNQSYYDCTYEWHSDRTFSKKHLLQSIHPEGVRHYYNYFNRGKKLVVRNLKALEKENEILYRLLLPQSLTSFLCGQMVYDDHDLGFLGVDNPAPERFDELAQVFDALRYYLTVRIFQDQTMAKLENHDESQETYSLYSRISRIVPQEPLALVYCSITTKFRSEQVKDGILDKALLHAENVLCTIFGRANVFQLVRDEFLVFFDDNEEMDISSIHHYLTQVKTSLEAMNIVICLGIASTPHYNASFFELAKLAHTKMLRQRQKYRELYIGKYHLESPDNPYRDLIEVHPKENFYRILYTEYQHLETLEGRYDQALSRFTSMIVPEERQLFLDFIQEYLSPNATKQPPGGGILSRSFTLQVRENLQTITVSITAYRNVNGQDVYILYTS